MVKSKYMGSECMQFKFEGEDSRGKVWSFMIGDIEYILFFTKRGCMRGGDYHSKRQYNLVLHGAIEFYRGYEILIRGAIHRDVGVETSDSYYGGQMTVTPANVPHYMVSTTDSYVLEWHELPKTRRLYEPYRKLVEESKKVDWNPDPNITMVIRKGQDYHIKKKDDEDGKTEA